MIYFLVAMQIFTCQFKGRTETVQAESCERKSPIYEILLHHQKPPSRIFVLHTAVFISPLRPTDISIRPFSPHLTLQMDSQSFPD